MHRLDGELLGDKSRLGAPPGHERRVTLALPGPKRLRWGDAGGEIKPEKARPFSPGPRRHCGAAHHFVVGMGNEDAARHHAAESILASWRMRAASCQRGSKSSPSTSAQDG